MFNPFIFILFPEDYVEGGDDIIEYLGSGPQKDTGFHRYVFLVYKQRDGIIEHNEARSSNRYFSLIF